MKQLLLAALLAAGCREPPSRVSLDAVREAPPASWYVDELKKWTRHGHLIADFDDTLSVDATLHSPEFRAAYAEKWIAVYLLNTDEAARMRAQLNGQIADVWELHVETSAHVFEIADLSPKKSVWRVSLLDDQGRALQPLSIEAVKQRPETNSAFYPYASLFSRPWTVKFPRNLADGTPLVTPDTRWLTFRFAGPQGFVDLVWLVK
jgi:hypothetical protein